MKFNISFVGRERGAIGVFSNYALTINAVNLYAARIVLSNTHELHHIVSAVINDGAPTNKKESALVRLHDLDLTQDFHTLNSDTVLKLVDVAKAVGYRAGKNRNGSPARCFYEYLQRTPKTELLHVVQGNYGHGWEDLTASTDRAEARRDLKSYRENDTAPIRLIKRREKV